MRPIPNLGGSSAPGDVLSCVRVHVSDPSVLVFVKLESCDPSFSFNGWFNLPKCWEIDVAC